MTELSVACFRNLLEKNVTELKGNCEDWKKLSTTIDLPEMVSDEIRSVVGLTNLLLQQKLKQFASLIDDSEFKRGEKEITCLDLEGFWDMVYSEIEKIKKKFQNLEKCQQNNWVFVEEAIAKREPKKKPILANTAKIATDAKARAIAVRQRLAEAKLKMKSQTIKNSEDSTGVQMLCAMKDNEPHQKIEEQKFEEISKSNVAQDRSPIKRTLKSIRNIRISEQDDLSAKSEVPSKKLPLKEMVKGRDKRQKLAEKENLIKTTEDDLTKKMQKNPGKKLPEVNLKGKSNKEVIPLQCVTRSAKRAMLANKIQ